MPIDPYKYAPSRDNDSQRTRSLPSRFLSGDNLNTPDGDDIITFDYVVTQVQNNSATDCIIHVKPIDQPADEFVQIKILPDEVVAICRFHKILTTGAGTTVNYNTSEVIYWMAAV